MKDNKILILDDEFNICMSLTIALEDDFTVSSTTNVAEAFELVKRQKFDVCLLDLRIGEYNGLDVLERIKQLDKDIAVIMMTAYFTLDSTVEAIRRGAYTYVTKPINLEGLKLTINQAIEYKELNERVEYLAKELQIKYGYGGIIGKSPAMKSVFTMIEKLKDVDTNVLITGESGTGKELIAKAIHFNGKRKNSKFVEINCAAIPENLLEEELFGHKKGSFTGAIGDKKGKFEFADNGTIFLDEIGEMPLQLQAKLLRVLQEKKFTPIGDNEERKINARVICATNRDLKEMVKSGNFRSDLYFRLNVMEINVPRLEERKQDLQLLINFFIEKYNMECGKSIIGLSREAELKLMDYNYPGNVRELSNIIERAIVIAEGDVIESGDLPDSVQSYSSGLSANGGAFTENLIGCTLKEIEKKVIIETLIRNRGSRKKTAEMLGISEKGLFNKIREYQIEL